MGCNSTLDHEMEAQLIWDLIWKKVGGGYLVFAENIRKGVGGYFKLTIIEFVGS